jgi:acyl carrier protein
MTRPSVDKHVSAAEYTRRVRSIVAEELELDEDELTETGHFVEDYEGDSLALITVMARIDRELSVSIPKTMLTKLTDLRTLTAAVLAETGLEPVDG